MNENKPPNLQKFLFKVGEWEIDIIIPEFPSDELGSRLWPSSFHLCEYLIEERENFRGKTILELGCGKALPGILAKKLGANVILSDRSSSHFEARVAECLRVNGVEDVRAVSINWGQVDENVTKLPPIHFIIASDSFFDSTCFEPLISTFSYLLHKNPSCVLVCAYEERSIGCGIEMLLMKWGLKASLLPSMGPALQDIITGDIKIMAENEIKLYKISLK